MSVFSPDDEAAAVESLRAAGISDEANRAAVRGVLDLASATESNAEPSRDPSEGDSLTPDPTTPLQALTERQCICHPSPWSRSVQCVIHGVHGDRP